MGVLFAGMTSKEAFDAVQVGYRMPKPNTSRMVCPDAYYAIMLKCWSRNPDDRPTFQFLYTFFDDYFINSESQYGDS